MENDNRFVGLILAAGYSSRMGAFKPLLPIGDRTAIEWVADTLRKAGVKDIIGVTGFLRERLSSILLTEEITEAFNQNFERGMFSSIKVGISKALSISSPEGFLLLLVDCPLVPPEVINLILMKHKERPDAFIVPCFRGKKGHPLFIPVQYAEEIMAFEGDGGMKAITNRYEDRLVRLEVGTEAVVLDMDTPDGYDEVLAYYAKQGNDDLRIEEELKGKRLFLIRHGEIRQHREKIFLGQTDVPLSDMGREQAAKAVVELKQYGISANRIYTSDLSRAWETAEIIRDILNPQAVLIKEPKLRELSLGDWDGRFISEIQREYPEEYRRRGETLPIHKLGNNSENFYDLQYRAMKGLQHILEQERKAKNHCDDVIIVTHAGVINVIRSYLHCTELEEEMRNPISNGGIVVIDYSNTK